MKTLLQPRDLRELQSRLATLTDADTGRWGQMSVGQMVCHLREAFAVGLGERPVTPVKPPLPQPVMKWLALRAPVAWPKNVPTVPELKVENVATQPIELTADRAEALEKMLYFADRREITTPHPIFGRMETADWMRWGYLHTDHHLRQFGR